MNDVTCLDMYGNTLHHFFQWDLNQKIYIEDSEFTVTPEFHYQNKNTTKALVVKSSIDSNGVISVDVPNQLLIEPYPITVYIYASSSGSAKSVVSMQFPVYPRQQPNDFVYEDNVDFIVLEDIQNQFQEYTQKIEDKVAELVQNFNLKIQELQNKINNLTASDIFYDNSISGLVSTNVQDAIDEMMNGIIFVDPSDKDDEPTTDGDTDDGSGDDSSDTDNGETSTTETIYLYNRGVTSDLVGNWENYTTEIYDSSIPKPTIVENSDCLTISISKTPCDSCWISSTNTLSLDGTWDVYIEYDYSTENEFTGAIKTISGSSKETQSGQCQELYVQKGTNLVSSASTKITGLSFSENYFLINFFNFITSQSEPSTISIHAIWLEKEADSSSDDTTEDNTGSDDTNSGIVYLYNKGDECEDVTGGWALENNSTANNLTLSKETSYIEFACEKQTYTGSSVIMLNAETNNNVFWNGNQYTIGVEYSFISDEINNTSDDNLNDGSVVFNVQPSGYMCIEEPAISSTDETKHIVSNTISMQNAAASKCLIELYLSKPSLEFPNTRLRIYKVWYEIT